MHAGLKIGGKERVIPHQLHNMNLWVVHCMGLRQHGTQDVILHVPR